MRHSVMQRVGVDGSSCTCTRRLVGTAGQPVAVFSDTQLNLGFGDDMTPGSDYPALRPFPVFML